MNSRNKIRNTKRTRIAKDDQRSAYINHHSNRERPDSPTRLEDGSILISATAVTSPTSSDFIRREPQLQYYMDDNRCTEGQRSTDDVLQYIPIDIDLV
ncbi:hypothetical protein DPMN_037752 [Dreissena polymorpha]|uniref:Uncharacterized protein n=1 Tax=Dreissena polymorpha TaxID=45954 RepID=A0A9D4MBJ1_DREPO|nr:hypothetical protein DPMN_037752 [Dreissena polymorpha]